MTESRVAGSSFDAVVEKILQLNQYLATKYLEHRLYEYHSQLRYHPVQCNESARMMHNRHARTIKVRNAGTLWQSLDCYFLVERDCPGFEAP